LIVDEAQNLAPAAIEELRMLSNFQLGSHALLQSFLVGQPELRKLLLAPSMEQFRQRVIASCHLGPLGAAETRAYVEHRLKRVGWRDAPRFDERAFDEIHRWTGGVPRRINLLCNRLLLDCFLAGRAQIDVLAVETVARDLRGELGDESIEPPPQRFAGEAAVPGLPVGPPEPAQAEAVAKTRPVIDRSSIRLAPKLTGPLLGAADSPTDDLKMAALLRALPGEGGLPPAHCVRMGDPAAHALNDSLWRQLSLPAPLESLAVAADAAAAARTAECMQRFERLVGQYRPSAILLPGCSDVMLACALVANKSDTRLVWIDDAVRSARRKSSEITNRRLIARMADVIYTSEAAAQDGLAADGVASDRVQFVGNLFIDAARCALAARGASDKPLRRLGSGEALHAAAREGYGLVAIRHSFETLDPRALAALLAALDAASRELPLLLSIDPRIRAGLERSGLGEQLARDRMLALEPLDYCEHIALLGEARCVITDSPAVQEEATAFGLCCFSSSAGEVSDVTVALGSNTVVDFSEERLAAAVGATLRNGGKRASVPDRWDGQTAARIVAHLDSFMGKRAPSNGASRKAAA
jgi:UDP-N-acetylglucosamine 2-epimerase